MKLPKLTRAQIYAAKGKPIEIALPDSEEVRRGQAYALEGEKGGKRQATIFIDEIERRGEARYATVWLTDEPRLLARQQGLKHPDQYTTSELAALPNDPGEAVDEDAQRRLTTEGHARFAKHRQEIAQEDERKAQNRSARSELTESLEGLDEVSRLAFLAQFQRMCKQAKGRRQAA